MYLSSESVHETPASSGLRQALYKEAFCHCCQTFAVEEEKISFNSNFAGMIDKSFL